MSGIDQIKIVTWNIQGLLKKDIFGNYECKNQSDEFFSSIKNADIICLTETWTCNETIDFIDNTGYSLFYSNRKAKHKKSKRNNGGIIVFVKNSISKGVSKQHSASDDLLWLKLSKNFFNCEKDMFLCTAYLAPQTSTFFTWQDIDILDVLERETEKYSNLGFVTICGDLNSRTKCKPDILTNDTNRFVPLPDNYVVQETSIPERNNQDCVENQYGNWLINLCISKQLIILNGRTTGDTVGGFTYYGPNGSSTIDYFLVNQSLFKNVNYLEISDLTTLSDHCAIILSLNLPGKTNNLKKVSTDVSLHNPNYMLNSHINKFIWDESSNDNFKSALEHNQLELDRILSKNCPASSNEIDSMITDFTSYLHNISKASIKLVSPKGKPRKRSKQKTSFDADCATLKTELKYKLKLMNQYPHNRLYREEYYKFRRHYRKIIKLKETEYKDKILNQLETLKESDPKAYWSLLNKLKNVDKKADTDNISPQDWYSYFKDLSYKESINQSDNFKDILASKENENLSNTELDYPISEKELHDQISRLKSKDTSSLDLISTRMIRAGRHYLAPFLLKLYNYCLNQSYFPKDWNIGLLTPIFKKGSKNDPGNFRGIAITSTLGKIFTAILQNRLVRYLTETGNLNENQSGFLPGRRTSDNIFILSQLIEHTKKNKQPLYLAFIDFQKAFDTVWHEGLLYKLLMKGIGGNFYHLIKSMYSQKQVSVNKNYSETKLTLYDKYIKGKSSSNQQHLAIKLSSGITNFFPCNIGVKQGDCLSPILFDCFIDDICNYLVSDTNDGFKIDDTTYINSLLYADDLVIFSTSYDEMQKSLTKLQNYCSNWKLQVNVKKSKMMSIGTSSIKHFTFNNAILENVKSYSYLGLSITEKGLKFSADELALKAQKAWFGLKNTLYSTKIKNVKTILKLFDMCIKPILTYASETWAPFYSSNNILNLQSKTENVHLQCCKWVLNVSRNCSNLGILGELGRTPLLKDIQLYTIKYWLHLSMLPHNSLMYKVYLHAKTNNLKWYLYVKDCLQKLDIDISTTSLNDALSRSTFISNVKERLSKLFNKEWNTKVSTGTNPKFNSKLRTYVTFKPNIYLENYLLNKNTNARELFTKLRLSDHKLAIESGRRKNIKLENRLCMQCRSKNMIEDEFHFTMICPNHSKLREDLFKSIALKNNDFLSLSQKDQFIYIMSYKSNEDDILKYVKKCFENRQTNI